MERNDGLVDWFVDTVERLDENRYKNTDTKNVEDRIDRDGADWIVVGSLQRQEWSDYNSTNKQVVKISPETFPQSVIL